MDVPPEILQTSMRTHQKYFALRDGKTGKLARRFALVSTWQRKMAARRLSPAMSACCARGSPTRNFLGPRPQAHPGIPR